MATFLFDFVNQLDNKWREVDILIAKAKDIRSSDEELYNAICRSVTVLLVAHLEGFTKDLAKNIVKDLNHQLPFKDFPEQVKRTYCKKYLGSNHENKDKSYEKKLKRLVSKFEELDCEITHEPFFSEINKNPNQNVIRGLFKGFGVDNIFEYLHESEFDGVFSESSVEINKIIDEIKNKLILGVYAFPYVVDLRSYNLIKTDAGGRITLWQEFIEQINQKRHGVAHGNDFENADDVASLEMKKNKVVLLELLLAVIISSKMQPTTNVEAA